MSDIVGPLSFGRAATSNTLYKPLLGADPRMIDVEAEAARAARYDHAIEMLSEHKESSTPSPRRSSPRRSSAPRN